MQYAWLEKLAASGQVREEVKDAIYKDCSYIFSKFAGLGLLKDRPFMNKYLRETGESVLKYAPVAIWGGLSWTAANKGLDKILSVMDYRKVMKTREKISKDPEFSKYKDKALARFDEIGRVAPNLLLKEDFVRPYIASHLHSGFTPTDLERLAIIQLSTASSKYRDLETPLEERMAKKATVSPVTQAQILADVLCIVKEAAPRSASASASAVGIAKQLFGTLAAVSAAHALVGVGTGAINVLQRKHQAEQLKQKLESSYTTAMRRSDPMREPLHENKDKARQAFETLVHFAPHVATNPSAARAFMNSMVSHDLGTSIGSVKELSEIERNISTIEKQHPFLEGLRGGLDTAGFPRFFGDAAKEVIKPLAGSVGHEIAGTESR